MKIERDEFARLPIDKQMLVIFDNIEGIGRSIKYKIAFYASFGGLIGGALTLIGNWSFWGQ